MVEGGARDLEEERARALLDAYRAEGGPSPAAEGRLRERLRRGLGEAVGSDMSEETCPNEPVPITMLRDRRRWGLTLALVAVAAALVAALSLRPEAARRAASGGSEAAMEGSPATTDGAARRRGQPPSATEVEAPDDAAPPSPRPAAVDRGVPAPATGASEPVERRTTADAPGNGPAPADEPAHGPADAPADGPADGPADAPADALWAEMQLLRPAHRALAEGRPNEALDALARHAERFPTGALAEERAALRAVALCEAGRRREGEAEARALLRGGGASLFAARIRGACDLEGGATESPAAGHPPAPAPSGGRP